MRISIDNRLYMDCPDGFHELTEDEQKEMNLSSGGKGLCISDPVKQIMIFAEWVQVSGLHAWLLGRREVSWTMSSHIEKKLKPFSFVWIDDVKRTISDKLARGMDYEYVAKGIHMTCESLAIKDEENLYYFHMYARKIRREESLEIFHEILDGVVIND